MAGINTVMYYTPAILELAGFHDKRSALLVALCPAAGPHLTLTKDVMVLLHTGTAATCKVTQLARAAVKVN